MRWAVFCLFVLIMLALELGLKVLLGIPDAQGVTPSFLLILAVFVAMSAPRQAAVWAALVAGLVVDLTQPVRTNPPLAIDGGVVDLALLGPVGLGYLAGALVTFELRGLVFRDSTIAFAALVFTAGLFVQLVVVGLITLRGLAWVPGEPIVAWSAADQLVQRFFQLLYTAVLAVPIGFVLLRFDAFWGFKPDGVSARGRARRIS